MIQAYSVTSADFCVTLRKYRVLMFRAVRQGNVSPFILVKSKPGAVPNSECERQNSETEIQTSGR
jgi:hypothetical protein